VPFVFAGNYNGPGQWRYGLGFVETGGFFGGEGSFAGYESAAMYSPALDTAIVVASTKLANAITPPPMVQALAMAVYPTDVDFGLTPAEAMQPNNFDTGPAGKPDICDWAIPRAEWTTLSADWISGWCDFLGLEALLPATAPGPLGGPFRRRPGRGGRRGCGARGGRPHGRRVASLVEGATPISAPAAATQGEVNAGGRAGVRFVVSLPGTSWLGVSDAQENRKQERGMMTWPR